MKITGTRAALLLGGCLLFTGHLAATPSHAEAWCKFENNSGENFTIVNVDATTKTSVGSLWVRRKSAKDNGVNIQMKGESATIAIGSNEVYFDTTASRFAAHYLLQGQTSGRKIYLHVTNCDPLEPAGTQIRVTADPLSSADLTVDFRGYRNKAGGTLFTLSTPVPPGSDTDN